MTPQSQPRKKKNSSRESLVVALVVHAALVVVILYFAVHTGIVGDELKKIGVTMLKEPPPDKPKEPEKTPPPPEIPKETSPRLTTVAPLSPPPAEPVAPENVAVAPAPASLPSFSFDDGARSTETATPAVLYKNFVEYTLRAHWNRPEDSADTDAAEVEISVDPTGRITGDRWKKGSGDARWDASVRQAIAATRLERPPPPGFPSSVLVRFDTAPEPEQAFQ